MRNREHRAPRELARDDVAGGEGDLDSTVAGVSHIREICVVARALVRLHRKEKVRGPRFVCIDFEIDPFAERGEIEAYVI